MRSRRTVQDPVAEVARRRLELLSAELAGLRSDPSVASPEARSRGGEVGETPGGLPPAEAEVPTGRHASRPAGRGELVGGWLQDRLPPTLQGRVQLGSAHLAVLGLVVAVAVAGAGFWALTSGSSGTSVPAAPRPPRAAPTSLVSLPSPAVSSGTASPTGAASSGTVVVDVAGRVRRPGIASLPVGARVVDALRAVGGARPGVDLSTLNLARVLVDGEQILVGRAPPPGLAASAAGVPTAAASGPAALVNVNTADQAALESLPGIGPVTAQAILKWRSENGAFTAVDQLLDVSGIGDATLAEIAPFVTL